MPSKFRRADTWQRPEAVRSLSRIVLSKYPQMFTGLPEALVGTLLSGVSLGFPIFSQFFSLMIVRSEPVSSCKVTCAPLMLALTYFRCANASLATCLTAGAESVESLHRAFFFCTMRVLQNPGRCPTMEHCEHCLFLKLQSDGKCMFPHRQQG